MASGQQISCSRAARPARGWGGLFIPAPAPPRSQFRRLGRDISSLREGAKGSPCSRLLLSPAATGLETKSLQGQRAPGTERGQARHRLVQPSRAGEALQPLCYFLLLEGLKLQSFTDFGLILSSFGMKINSLPSPSPF